MSLVLPPPQVTKNPDGSETIVSYRQNDEGKKVKVTRRIKITSSVVPFGGKPSPRREWERYGLEKQSSNQSLATFDEEVDLNLSVKTAKASETEEKKPVKKTAVMGGLHCRHCQGEHFTHLCPYKDKLGGVPEDPVDGLSGEAGKFQPSLRGSRFDEQEERNTLRVSNLPADITDADLRDTFGRAGRVTRCHVVRDRQTGKSRGFAYVEFEERGAAELAQRKLNRTIAGHLVISVEFSKK